MLIYHFKNAYLQKQQADIGLSAVYLYRQMCFFSYSNLTGDIKSSTWVTGSNGLKVDGEIVKLNWIGEKGKMSNIWPQMSLKLQTLRMTWTKGDQWSVF